jgi:hypothetical protein
MTINQRITAVFAIAMATTIAGCATDGSLPVMSIDSVQGTDIGSADRAFVPALALSDLDSNCSGKVTLTGTAVDAEDGALPEPAMIWRLSEGSATGTPTANGVFASPPVGAGSVAQITVRCDTTYLLFLTGDDSDGNRGFDWLRLVIGAVPN